MSASTKASKKRFSIGSIAWLKIKAKRTRCDIIYWRNVKNSLIALAIGLISWVASSCFPVTNILAFLTFLMIFVIVALRIHKYVKQTLQENDYNPLEDTQDIIPNDAENESEKA